ncbi:MAG: efflux RND transporter periplasmic adaptor subunit [Gammaproteobacteria bacterium]|jgi:multidrug efflux system membrane fusion protein|nr:efflux RND transporter periplasmic adaptor subunit [Gammaproteobacteria bacterium]
MKNKFKSIVAKQPWLLAALTLVIVSIWMGSGFVDREEDQSTESGATLGISEGDVRVQVDAREAQNIQRYITVYGNSNPARTVEMSTEAEGRIEKIFARRGDRLNAGDPILKLDIRDRQARVDQAKASVREHQTRYDGQQSLKKDGYASDSQMAETLAKLEAARAEYTRAKLDLANMTIRAPFSGTLQSRTVEIGDFVRAGDTVGTFVDNNTIIITGSVAERDAGNVKVGDIANATLVTGQDVSGNIRYVSQVAERETRTFVVELEIPNPDGSLPAGVTAEMRIATGEVLAHEMSPALLSLSGDGSLGVNTVDEFDRVQFYPVEIIQSGNEGTWVSGLPKKVQLIVVGQGYVSQGQQVDSVSMTADTAMASGIRNTLEAPQ